MEYLPSLGYKFCVAALFFLSTFGNALGNGSPTNKALNVGDAVFCNIDDWREHNKRGQVPHSRLPGLDSGSGHRMVRAQKGGNVFLVLPAGQAPSTKQRVSKGLGAGDLIGTVFRSGPSR